MLDVVLGHNIERGCRHGIEFGIGGRADAGEAIGEGVDVPRREEEAVDPVTDEMGQGHGIGEHDGFARGQGLERGDRLQLGRRRHAEEGAALVGLHELCVADLSEHMDAVGDAQFGAELPQRLLLIAAADDIGFEAEGRIGLRHRLHDVRGPLLRGQAADEEHPRRHGAGGGGVELTQMSEPLQVDSAGHRPDGGGEAVLREQIRGQLSRNRDEVGRLELSAQVPPGDRGAAVEDRLGRPDVGAHVVGHEVIGGHDRDAAAIRFGERVSADDEVRLGVHDIGLKTVEQPGELGLRLPWHADHPGRMQRPSVGGETVDGDAVLDTDRGLPGR